MAFKFNKMEIRHIADSVIDLQTTREAAEKAIKAFADAIASAEDAMRDAIDAYGNKVEDAKSLMEEIHGRVSEEYEAKSDGWKDSDDGCDVSDWISELSELCDGSFPFPEKPDFDDLLKSSDIFGDNDAAGDLEAQASEPQE